MPTDPRPLTRADISRALIPSHNGDSVEERAQLDAAITAIVELYETTTADLSTETRIGRAARLLYELADAFDDLPSNLYPLLGVVGPGLLRAHAMRLDTLADSLALVTSEAG